MAIKLGINIESLRSQRQLDAQGQAVSKTLERLSSGLRINRAADDPAGMAIASQLKADSRVLHQGGRNLNDGLSLLNVAEGALHQLSEIVTRQLELAEQAANGTYSFTQRKALNREAESLTQEYNRIVESTAFNGQKLLDGSLTNLSLQAGYSSISFNLGSELARTVGTGSFANETMYTVASFRTGVALADLNRDGAMDAISVSDAAQISVQLGNGDGSLKAAQVYAAGTGAVGNLRSILIDDLNKDGISDVVTTDISGSGAVNTLIGNGDGSFQAVSTLVLDTDPMNAVLADFTQDGVNDIVVTTSTGLRVLGGNGNGTFGAATSVLTTINFRGNLTVLDFDRDGINDLAGLTSPGVTLSLLRGQGDGTFSRSATSTLSFYHVSSADLNLDGYEDVLTFDYNSGAGNSFSVFMNRGNGTFATGVSNATVTGPYTGTVTDLNLDGIPDLLVATSTLGVHLGNGDGTFKSSTATTSATVAYQVLAGDMNNDGAPDLVVADRLASRIGVALANTQEQTQAPHLSLYTASDARAALESLRGTSDRISAELGSIGAFQSRIAVSLSNLRSMSENYTAAAGRILDADVASDAAELTRRSILQQAVVAVLAQANQQPLLALDLLQN